MTLSARVKLFATGWRASLACLPERTVPLTVTHRIYGTMTASIPDLSLFPVAPRKHKHKLASAGDCQRQEVSQ